MSNTEDTLDRIDITADCQSQLYGDVLIPGMVEISGNASFRNLPEYTPGDTIIVKVEMVINSTCVSGNNSTDIYTHVELVGKSISIESSNGSMSISEDPPEDPPEDAPEDAGDTENHNRFTGFMDSILDL